MLACPTCSKRLRPAATKAGRVYVCAACRGRAVSLDVLKKTASADFLRRLRHATTGSHRERSKTCPRCARAMSKVDFGRGYETLLIDVCGPCRLVWFDPGEYERTAAAPPPPPAEALGGAETAAAAAPAAPPPPPREAAAPEAPGPGDDGPAFALTGPEHAWQMVPAIFGLPIEYGPNRLRSRPILTWGLTGAMVLIFALLAGGGAARLSEAIARWGFVPARWARRSGLTLITAFFLHAGWWHVIANGYFLLIFGDNVEDHLGKAKFLLLLASAHLAGMALHGAMTSQPQVPCAGASAGISGVIAYYAVAFPRAKIGIFGWWFTLFRILRMPAFAGLVLYVLVQLVGLYFAGRAGGASVAYLAHLGGLAVGVCVGIIARARYQ